MTPSHVVPLGSRFRQLAQLAIPIALGQLGQTLMSFVDVAVMGYVGAVPLAGVSLGHNLFLCVAMLPLGVLLGVDPLMSQAVGAGDVARSRRLLVQGGYLAVVLGLLFTVPFFFASPIFRLFSVEEAVIQQATGYLLYRGPAMLPFFVFVMARGYLQSVGKVRALVTATVIGNVANLLFDLLLVFGGASLPAAFGPLRRIPAMGAAGAGLATLLCSFVMMFWLLWAVRCVAGERLGWFSTPVDLSSMRRTVQIGFPIGLHMLAEVGLFTLVGLFAAKLGTREVAAHQLVLSCASLAFSFAIGIGNAAAVVVGWSIGAQDTRGARASGLVAVASGAALMGSAGLIMVAFREPIARFMAKGSPEVVSLAASLMLVAAAFQIADALQGVGAGVLRGIGETKFTWIANLLGHYAVGLPVALWLGLRTELGLKGMWWGLFSGLTVVGVSLLYRFLDRTRSEIQPL